jgi:hypothetical protein
MSYGKQRTHDFGSSDLVPGLTNYSRDTSGIGVGVPVRMQGFILIFLFLLFLDKSQVMFTF